MEAGSSQLGGSICSPLDEGSHHNMTHYNSQHERQVEVEMTMCRRVHASRIASLYYNLLGENHVGPVIAASIPSQGSTPMT